MWRSYYFTNSSRHLRYKEKVMKERPQAVSGTTYEALCPCGDLYITLNDDEQGELFEAFITLGKAGGCGSANKAAVGVLISIALRNGVAPEFLIKGLSGIQCHRSSAQRESCIAQIATTLREHEEAKKVVDNTETKTGSFEIIG
jgi:hypothetical protein